MSFVIEYFSKAKRVITSPTEFFEDEKQRNAFGYPIKFATFSLVLVGLLSAAELIFAGPPSQFSFDPPVLAGVLVVGTPIIGVLILLIDAALIHIFVALLGGQNGYSQTLGAISYAIPVAVLGPAASLVASIVGTIGTTGSFIGSILGVLAGLVQVIYGLYVQTRGISEFQDLSLGESFGAIVLSLIIIAVFVFALSILATAILFAQVPV